VVRSCLVRDLHALGVSLSTLAHVSHGLLFRLRKVLIWDLEGRLGQLPEKARALHVPVPAGFFFFFSEPIFLSFLFVCCLYIFILIHSLSICSCFKLGFPSFLGRESFSLVTPMAFGNCCYLPIGVCSSLRCFVLVSNVMG
jgi:hypothetical protein